MKFLYLVWSNLKRRKLRTSLTLSSVLVAFVLFAILCALKVAFTAGVNLADFGANAMYRHIRYESSPLGEARRVVCYKVAREDPLWGIDPDKVTANWRNRSVADPARRTAK